MVLTDFFATWIRITIWIRVLPLEAKIMRIRIHITDQSQSDKETKNEPETKPKTDKIQNYNLT